jgi:Cu(I)/Ag(I) efflux system membrane fusion protein/cobalt-zinc-cadmium efflux system membrane fusion protein
MDTRTPVPASTRFAALRWVVAAVIVIAALAGAAYTWRDRLPALPVFGEQAPSGDHKEMGHASPSSPVTTDEADALEPRAPVTLDLRRRQLIGVRTAPVERTDLTTTVRAVGTVRYDETRLADVNLKLEGWIEELFVDYTGRLVLRGQPLFTLYSPDLLATQSEYLLALKTRDQLRESQIPDVRESAERLVESARQRLELWDLPPEELQALEQTRQTQRTITFRSPVGGYVIDKPAVKGMHVMPGQTLFRVADLSRVWVEADVHEQEMRLVRVGRSAVVTLDAYPGERFTGRAVYVYPFVEERTRTVRVRFEFANPNGRLRPGMYANVELQAPGGMGLTVPSNAVIESGRQQIVFVELGDGYFEPRRVQVGRRLGDRVEVLERLEEGERVAMAATFFLDSESQLRGAVEGYEPQAPAPASQAGRQLDVSFGSTPDPPSAGDNTFEVAVRDADGRPIADGEVSVTFFMAAMPTMNMPAMRSETKLSPVGDGVYRGSGQILMSGRWDVTVAVSRGGQRLGSRQFSVTTR